MTRYFCITLLVILAGCQHHAADMQKASVTPVHAGETVHLRVLHAVNPRFPKMSPEQLRTMLDTARKTVKQNFNVDIEFDNISETSIADLFARLPSNLTEEISQAVYDFKHGKGNRDRLIDGIYTSLKQHNTRLGDALLFARPYLPEKLEPDSLESLSALLAQVMLDRLDNWRSLKAADGQPVIDDSPYNEWSYWDALGYTELPYDIVISNQLIASAEYVDIDVHSALRGGVSVGTTSYSRNNRYAAFSFWSTFPFLDTSAYSRELRGGETYTPQEAAELSGAYLAHEIGHMLFQFNHPFGQQACVMNPAQMLRFRAWREHLDATACAIGSRPEMMPGAIPVYFSVRLKEMGTTH